jgi:hypothetical protein
MAARFYAGASLKSTRSLSQLDKSPAVQKNSMKGLPGFIRTTADRVLGNDQAHHRLGLSRRLYR